MDEKNIQQTADKMEQVIGEVFWYADTVGIRLTNYSLLYDSEKDNSWYIVLWVGSKEEKSEAIRNGRFYFLHQFLHPRVTALDEGLSVGIRLESGTAPQTPEEYTALLDRCLFRYESGEEDNKVCRFCGHPAGKHQLKGFAKEPDKFPREGWMVCPEPDCDCFLTWDAPIK